jgi:hypothetical protein
VLVTSPPGDEVIVGYDEVVLTEDEVELLG